ncbi:hypothetical protein SAMN04489732_1266 [Amycolatopsis saalfeldensis]|uniref:Uncharacterized protein n=1 Tax=Amycolatopsis saalfeldensis TaxID=394193 RepID=A0A1H8YMI5_9PSEU|nr:hypothetical protein SAMN04489732_1266 [Amycolatopsis saalfeldensis]
MLGENQPDAIADRKIGYLRPHRVDDAGAVLARRHFIEQQRSDSESPIGGIDSGTHQADPNFARTGLGNVALGQRQNVGGAGASVDDGSQVETPD